MTLYYHSTRDKSQSITASQAILQGLAPDGGLYVPTTFPQLDLDFAKLQNATYQEAESLVLRHFFDDFSVAEIDQAVQAAYDAKFDTPAIAPSKKVGDHYLLELFHGETIAFKDMALSILPHLMVTAAKKNANTKEIVILTATSGDTGKAAMAGFADVPNTKIIVFYPKHGVSPIQEKQMVSQKGSNVHVVGIEGNFDQAQTAVKAMFNDLDLRDKMAAAGKQFSSANSMNIGRLIPQVAYYVWAYLQLVKSQEIQAGQAVNFAVPTGNFGNILAAYYAKKIGLPIGKLICASNKNKVLTDFFATGIYDKNRDFFVTSSPSMDILVSSNLERLIFELTGQDDHMTQKLLTDLSKTGHYQICPEMQAKLNDFQAGWASEDQILQEIKQTFAEDHETLDPHTAVASQVYRQLTAAGQLTGPTVVVSTASPYKFPRVVLAAIAENQTASDDFALLGLLEKASQIPQPQAVKGLAAAPILHDTVIATSQMQAQVEKYLGLKG